jgi:hypothetical protein
VGTVSRPGGAGRGRRGGVELGAEGRSAVAVGRPAGGGLPGVAGADADSGGAGGDAVRVAGADVAGTGAGGGALRVGGADVTGTGGGVLRAGGAAVTGADVAGAVADGAGAGGNAARVTGPDATREGAGMGDGVTGTAACDREGVDGAVVADGGDALEARGAGSAAPVIDPGACAVAGGGAGAST